MINSIVLEDIFNKEKCVKWNNIVRSFPDYDVYSLPEYAIPFAIHGDGIPLIIYYKSSDFMAYSVQMLRKIVSSVLIGDYYDIISPYGYGGWHFKGNYSADDLKFFYQEIICFLRNHNIVSSFVRYTPLNGNFIYDEPLYNIKFIGKTVEINLDSQDIIWNGITSKNRNCIRKAIKNDIIIRHGHNDLSLLKLFKRMYDDTMRRDNANSYYFFSSEFYHALDYYLSDNYELFYAIYNDQIISMAIILYANDSIHYHLSCSEYEYRSLAPSNLLLYEVAKWGCDNGFKHFHLGGGLGGHQDQLYKFKASFNRYSDCSFYIGKLIVNINNYDILVDERCQTDHEFDKHSDYFPLYRK